MENLKKAVGEFLLLGDDGAVEAVVAAVIANRLDLDAVWLMLTSASSSGKTELVNPLFGLPFIIPISDLTANTFASGFKMGGGKQASLLLRHQSGIMVFKDFTSILSKNRETRDQILSQMREIYEGKYDKQTGTGETIAWKGKMGAIAASTEAVYHGLADSTEMGQRFIYYHMKQPVRFDAAKRAQENANKSGMMREMLVEEYKRYINMVLDKIGDGKVQYEPPQEIIDEMLRVADFASLARSPIHTDFKSGLVDTIASPEMPGRITKQLSALAGAFMAMNQSEGVQWKHKDGEVITDHQRNIIYRCAFDSIPQMRRAVLKLLGQYRGGISTSGCALVLALPTDSVRKYLQQVNALGLCTRRKDGGKTGDMWIMENEEYRKVISRLENFTPKDQQLLGNDDDETYSEEGFDSTTKTEEQRAADELFDAM